MRTTRKAYKLARKHGSSKDDNVLPEAKPRPPPANCAPSQLTTRPAQTRRDIRQALTIRQILDHENPPIHVIRSRRSWLIKMIMLYERYSSVNCDWYYAFLRHSNKFKQPLKMDTNIYEPRNPIILTKIKAHMLQLDKCHGCTVSGLLYNNFGRKKKNQSY